MSITCDYANPSPDQSVVNYHFDSNSMTVLAATHPLVTDFVAGGGTISPYDPTTANAIAAAQAARAAELTRLSGLSADTNVATLLTQASTATTAQIDTWLTNNVTTLAQARTVLGALIKIVAVKVIG